jgi:YggT family protein
MILYRALSVFLEILTTLILVRVLFSWFRPRYRTSRNGWFYAIDELVWRATEPLMAPVRNILPTGYGIDFSPLVVLLLIRLIGNWLLQALYAAGL